MKPFESTYRVSIINTQASRYYKDFKSLYNICCIISAPPKLNIVQKNSEEYKVLKSWTFE